MREHVRQRDRRAQYVDETTAHLKRGRTDAIDQFDVVLVGGGIHTAAFLYTLRRFSPELKVLVAERSESICSTFAQLGDSLVLNSPTFTKTGLNANVVPGHFVQVSDFDELVDRPFPTAKHLHQLATMLMFHADADIQFGFDVQSIDGDDARYAVRSPERTVRARSVVVANGMGDPRRSAFRADERADDVIVGDELIARCFRDRSFVASLRGKRVAVIGAGDTANCVMEYLVPLVYPNRDYGIAHAPGVLPTSIVWIGQSATNVREYFFANKHRYCHSGGVIELFWDGDEPLELSPHVWRTAKKVVRCVPERLLSLRHASGAIELTTPSLTMEVDLVIDCTGRDNPLAATLLERDHRFVKGDIALHGGCWDDELDSFTPSPRRLDRRKIACALHGERIFFIGSACPVCEMIPDDEAKDGSLQYQEERTSLTNSKWSLEHSLPRTVAFAEQFARHL